jgi:hypothetical protein
LQQKIFFEKYRFSKMAAIRNPQAFWAKKNRKNWMGCFNDKAETLVCQWFRPYIAGTPVFVRLTGDSQFVFIWNYLFCTIS